MFHTTFNIANSLLLIAFVGPLARLVERMVKDDKSGTKRGPYELRLVPDNITDSVDSNLITIRRELAVMAGEVSTMLTTVMDGAKDLREFSNKLDDLTNQEQRVDDMQEQIIYYLTRATRQHLGRDQSLSVMIQQRVAHELESIADSTYGISLLMDRLYKKDWSFHNTGEGELMNFASQVLVFLRYNQDYLDRKLEDYDIDHAQSMEDGIDKMRDKLRKRSRRTIEKDEDVDVKGELLFMDIVRHLEHIGDSSLNVSQAIAELPE